LFSTVHYSALRLVGKGLKFTPRYQLQTQINGTGEVGFFPTLMFVPTIKNISAVPEVQLSDNLAALDISDKKDSNAEKLAANGNSLENDPVVTDDESGKQKEANATTTPGSKAKEEEELAQNSSKEETAIDTKEPQAAQPILIIEEEEVEASIEIAEHDKDRLIVTLPNGTRYETDRYCPHAGADLHMHGQISLNEYGREVGPTLMCAIHYWEFLLDKEGNSANGWATIDSCKLKDTACPVDGDSKLAW
jgi:nitrite reductase/ring-hydroxylating ferredoxin subunit